MSVFIGAISKKIVLNVGVNISTATTRQIKYEKPDGTTGYWTAAEESTTSISHTTVAATDLNEDGNWKLQSYIVTPAWTEHGNVVRMRVRKSLLLGD